jgi:hypothetical protein
LLSLAASAGIAGARTLRHFTKKQFRALYRTTGIERILNSIGRMISLLETPHRQSDWFALFPFFLRPVG